MSILFFKKMPLEKALKIPPSPFTFYELRLFTLFRIGKRYINISTSKFPNRLLLATHELPFIFNKFLE